MVSPRETLLSEKLAHARLGNVENPRKPRLAHGTQLLRSYSTRERVGATEPPRVNGVADLGVGIATQVLPQTASKILTNARLVFVAGRPRGGDYETFQLPHVGGLSHLKQRHGVPALSVPVLQMMIQALGQVRAFPE